MLAVLQPLYEEAVICCQSLSVLHLVLPSVFQKFELNNRETDWRILVPGLACRVSVMGVSETRVSRSTSLVTMANRTLADNPHINTPISTGPKVRHVCGRTTPTVA